MVDVTRNKLAAINALLSLSQPPCYPAKSKDTEDYVDPLVIKTGWGKNEHHHDCPITNLGFSSYVNACVQAIFHVPAFSLWVDQQISHISFRPEPKECISCALFQTWMSYKQSSLFTPLNLLSCLPKISPGMEVGKSASAKDFLTSLLSEIDKEYRSSECDKIQCSDIPMEFSISIRGKKYNLCSTVFYHKGTKNFNHYSCLCVCSDGRLRFIQDSMIKNVAYGTVLTSTDYTQGCQIYLYELSSDQQTKSASSSLENFLSWASPFLFLEAHYSTEADLT